MLMFGPPNILLGRNTLVRMLATVGVSILLLGGCAQQDGSEREVQPVAARSETALDHEAVELAVAMAQARAHAAVAQELFEANELEGAALHAAHLSAEVLDPLRGELEEHGADVEALSQAFAGVAGSIAAGDAAAVGESIGEIEAATIEAAEAVSGGASEEPAFDGSVVAALLDDASHEYEEAIAGDGSVGLLDEYQDAYGFVNEAEALYDEVQTAVEQASMEEAEEVEEAFAALRAALPQASAPDEAASAEEVEQAAALIAHELEETVGALPLEESDPAQVVANIESLLEDIENLYADGEAEEAAELAAEAYLENYEVIEAGVIQAAPEVNEELEPLLGAELRRQIEEGAALEDISSMVSRAKELLEQALTAVEEGSG